MENKNWNIDEKFKIMKQCMGKSDMDDDKFFHFYFKEENSTSIGNTSIEIVSLKNGDMYNFYYDRETHEKLYFDVQNKEFKRVKPQEKSKSKNPTTSK